MAKQFVDDELDDVQPAKAAVPPNAPTSPTPSQQRNTAPTPAAPTATARRAAAVTTEEDVEDTAKPDITTDDVEFGDEELMKREGLMKLLPEKGKTVRASILSFVKPKKGYSHYIPQKGTFRCLSARDAKGNVLEPAVCCEKLGDADMIIAGLVLHYTNAPTTNGKYVSTKGPDGKTLPVLLEWDIKWIKLSRSGYRAVSALPPEDMTVYDIDFTIAWRNAQGGGFNYNYASKARWKLNPELAAEVEAACKPYLDGKRLVDKLGKRATLLELKAAMSGAATTDVEDASLGEMDQL
jgi:hypothetical protein